MNNDREVLLRLVAIAQEVHSALCEPVGHSFDERRLGDELCAIESYLAEPRPKVVCLCGSPLLDITFPNAKLKEMLAGNIVLSSDIWTTSDDVKRQRDALHLRKIDLADEILVLDVEDYISSSSANAIAYAKKLGKRIRYWSQEC